MSLRPYLLAGVALGLAALVLRDQWPAARLPEKTQAVAPMGQVAVLNPVSQRGADDFAALFDHPLFDPTRSPPATVPEAVTPAPVVPDLPVAEVPTPDTPPHPVLMGTVTSPWPGGAYLGDDQGGPIVFLRPGQQSLGLHLEEVRPDSALFKGPDGEVTLPLQKIPAPQPDAALSQTPLDATPPDATLPEATLPAP